MIDLRLPLSQPSAFMRTLSFFSILLCGSLLATTALPGKESSKPNLTNQAWVLRNSDGLLQRRDLQEIVEAQNRRDPQAIKSALTSPDPVLRARAAFAAGSLQDPTLLPALTALLNDPDPKVRVDAAFALRQTPGANLQALLDHLRKETDPIVQAMLLGALGFQGDRQSYEEVLKLKLSNLEVPFILCSIYYLQRDIVSQEGIEAILALLDKKQASSIREQAAYFFYTLKRRQLKDPTLAARLAKIANSSNFQDPAVPYLLRYLASCQRDEDLALFTQWFRKGKSLRARSVAVESIGAFITRESARHLLIEALNDPEQHVAMTAGELLAASSALTEKNVATIKAALLAQRTNPSTHSFLWSILWKHGEKAYLRKLITKITPAEGPLLLTALSAAPGINITPFALQIAAATTHPNPQVNLLTGIYLAERIALDRSEKSFEAFDRFLTKVRDHRVRGDALFELAHSLKDRLPAKERATRFLAYYQKLLAEGDHPSAGACLIILGSTRDADALPILQSALAHASPLIREAAQRGLELAKKGTTKPIQDYILDDVPFLDPDWKLLRKYGRHPEMTFTTKLGDIVIQLDAEQAPVAVGNLIAHIEKKNFDQLYVYRLVPNHVIQAGPPGNFGSRIRSEFTRIPKVEHSFGIGDLGKDTASQHIAITHLMRPHNEGKYTNLGLVTRGRQIVKTVHFNELIEKTTIRPDPRKAE
jgi:cyclophilin family peptidyl-prolyl cis-trans isomerase